MDTMQIEPQLTRSSPKCLSYKAVYSRHLLNTTRNFVVLWLYSAVVVITATNGNLDKCEDSANNCSFSLKRTVSNFALSVVIFRILPSTNRNIAAYLPDYPALQRRRLYRDISP
jgi:hypothetical protein